MNAPSIAVTERRAPGTLGQARVLAAAAFTQPGAEPISLDDATIELARAEGLAPLLGARVGRGRIVVAASRESLIREHQMCVATSLVREQAVASFVERCRRSGIPVAWLKGMALIQGIFRPGERSMIDVDAMVPASRWDEACRIAVEVGGQPVDFPGRPYTVAHDYVRAFTAASGITIEVHRSVCESSLFGIDYDGPDGIFARATPGASGVVVLDDGDLFLTLAAHAAKHTFELPLRSFFDGLAMLQRRKLTVDHIAERAARWRMRTGFWLWMRSLHTLAPWLVEAPASEPLRWPPVAERVWAWSRDASAWQRFARLAWVADDSATWARHVLTRVGMRAADVVLTRRARDRFRV